MAFILNAYEVEEAETLAAHDFHRPNLQRAVLTLARLVEYANNNSDGWAYWRKPSNASINLQTLVKRYYLGRHDQRPDGDITASDLRSLYRPIKAFLTREEIFHGEVFPND